MEDLSKGLDIPLDLAGVSAPTLLLKTKVTGDAQSRFTLGADGAMSWGDGAGSPDVTFTRSGVGVLGVTGSLSVSGVLRLGETVVTEGVIQLRSKGSPFTVHVSNATFNGTRDDILFLGYNLLYGTTSTKVDSSEPTMKLAFEANYNSGSAFLTEFNLDYTSVDGLTTVRPIGIACNRFNNSVITCFSFNGGRVSFFSDVLTTAEVGRFVAGGLLLGNSIAATSTATPLQLSVNYSNTILAGRDGEIRLKNLDSTANNYTCIEHYSGTGGLGASLTFVNTDNTNSYANLIFAARTATVGFVNRFSVGAEVIVNDPGNDVDFRVEGDTVTNVFQVDASADAAIAGNFLRIGTATDANAQGDFVAGLVGGGRTWYDQSTLTQYWYNSSSEVGASLQCGATSGAILSIQRSTSSAMISVLQIAEGTDILTIGLPNANSASALEVRNTAAVLLFQMNGDGNLKLNNRANGQNVAVESVTELTTIAAAATTDTAIQIPANAVVLGVSVRNTVAIPTAATYTVTGTSSGTVFNTVAVPVAINTTDPGIKAGAFYNATAQTIRITPNLTPGTNVGRVRVTIHYYVVTPPTS